MKLLLFFNWSLIIIEIFVFLESPRASPRSHNRHRQSQKGDRESTPKHDIVVVTEGGPMEKDPDPELTKLNAIPVFHPVIKRSVNGSRGEMGVYRKT